MDDVQRWLTRQEPQWQHLQALLDQAETRGLSSLSSVEIQQMSSLYRMAAADLARSQARQVGTAITERLKALTLRGYAQVYQGRRRQEWRAILEFWRWGFPALVQATWLSTAVATAVFGIGGLVGWWYTWQDPAFMQIVIPAGIMDQVQEDGELWMGSIVGIEPLASSAIMRNNISVSFGALAGGMVAGLWTLLILWINGLHIGAIATLVSQNNLAYPFWAFVFPHGALELPAIFLSGGAGLLLARGLLFPGPYRRLTALKICGGQAIQIMFGVVPMLILAGGIEGFFSPAPEIPDALKYLVGLVLFGGLVFYLQLQPEDTSAAGR